MKPLKNTINLGIIGMGHVYDYQIKALSYIDNIHIVAVADKDESKKQKIVNGMRFYQDYRLMVVKEHLDAILISTPPASHYEIAKFCLHSGAHVLLEKPATLDLKEFDELIRIAKNNRTTFVIALHAIYGKEIAWFIEEYKNRFYAITGNITGFTCNFYDPYVQDGKITEHAKNLQGSWIDSGINALSVVNLLVRNLKIKESKHEYMDGINVESSVTFDFDGGTGTINTSWIKNINHKETLLEFENKDVKILLNHSAQQATLCTIEGETILADFSSTGERLVNHYTGVFNDFIRHLERGTDNLDYVYNLHRLLFLA